MTIRVRDHIHMEVTGTDHEVTGTDHVFRVFSKRGLSPFTPPFTPRTHGDVLPVSRDSSYNPPRRCLYFSQTDLLERVESSTSFKTQGKAFAKLKKTFRYINFARSV